MSNSSPIVVLVGQHGYVKLCYPMRFIAVPGSYDCPYLRIYIYSPDEAMVRLKRKEQRKKRKGNCCVGLRDL